MEYVGVAGERVPSLGLGTAGLTDHACVRTVDRALSMGYRHVDAAQAAGNEREIGRALAASGVDREACFLTTKLHAGNHRYEDVRRSTRESIERLGVEYLDVLSIHRPSLTVPLSETLRAMAELREEGLVRHLGVCNFTRGALERALKLSPAPILTDRVQYHPYSVHEELLSFCRERDVLLTASCPLTDGRVSGDERLVAIGERYGKTPSQVALRWLLQQGMVVVTTAGEDQLAETLAVFDFRLDEREMAAVPAPSLARTSADWVRGRFWA
ncbi:aldo/keto reductase [Natronorarus salvus]|uniref:aldo/keto reductase n=1 Tax=Natronorarus salvus TaxID=3117733 RepID=UPI002F26B5B0